MASHYSRTAPMTDPNVISHLRDRTSIHLHTSCREGGRTTHKHYAGRDGRPYIIKGASNKRYLTECVIQTVVGEPGQNPVILYLFKTDFLAMDQNEE